MISIEDITDEQLQSLRDAFGQCSLVYESLTLPELREDLFSDFFDTNGVYCPVTREALTREQLIEWFEIQLACEAIHVERQYFFVDRSAEQIEAHDREDAEFVAGIRTRFAAWLDANVPAEDC